MTTSGAQNQKDFTKYLKAEVNNINVDKWFEGIKQMRDPGSDYVEAWIQTKGHKFRETWNNSLCRRCEKWNTLTEHSRLCCLRMVDACNNYEEEPN